MVIARIVTGIALLAALAACGDDGSNPGVKGKSGDDSDRTYVVTGVTEKGEPKELVNGTEIRLRFDHGRLTATAGCNTMSGAYTLEGTRLTVEPMSMTEMGCDKPRMDQDAWLAGLFEKPVQFTDGGDGAVISGDTVLTIADRERVHPDKPLEGTRWILDGISSGDVASSVPDGTFAQLVVHGTSVRVLNACQQLEATGTVSGNEITWGPGRRSLDGCSDNAGSLGLEAGKTATFSITEDTLTLTSGDDGLTFRASR